MNYSKLFPGQTAFEQRFDSDNTTPGAEKQENDSDTADSDPKLLHVGGFSSFHTGGAHFGFGDGSVRFLSENLDLETYQALANRHDGQLISDY